MLITVIIFILILGLLVFIHEAGHFVLAKRAGMRVDEFGFGFPPRAFGFQKIEGKWRLILGNRQADPSNGTVYSINWIFLGGFVKIVGENNDEGADPNSFVNKSFSSRLFTLLGGVLMNVVLAYVLISIGFMIGLPTALDASQTLPKGAVIKNQKIVIAEVLPDSPAATAGVIAGDEILKVQGESASSITAVQEKVDSLKGQTIHFDLQRIDQPVTADVASLANPPAGRGPTGVALSTVGLMQLPPAQALWYGGAATYGQLSAIVSGLASLFTSTAALKQVGGPVKIAQLTGQVAHLGIGYLIQFTAFLSLNLAVLNSLPIPALDGGRVLFLIIEKVRGRRNNHVWEQLANTTGFLLLLVLMLAITAKDLAGIEKISSFFKSF